MARLRLAVSFVMVGITLVASFALARRTASANANVTQRTFEFTYQVHVPANSSAPGTLKLWLPLPASHDSYQSSANTPDGALRVTGDVQHSFGKDPEYGNDFVVFHPTPEQTAAGFDAGIRFTVTRKERIVLRNGASVNAAAESPAKPALLERYLQPDKLVPLNGVIEQLAKEKTEGATTPLEKARSIYNYVVSTMHYDKSGEGWGRGDAIWACDSKRGNCTDFHSVFIGMMRSSGIPARFEIGFPLPEGKTEGDIPGYHCWAEFYVDGIGWIPVDASEASKNPAKKDYFFGALDANRVLFTYGRDIRLSAEQKSDPLNYFIYPYAELNGQPFKGLQTHFSFREISVTVTPSVASH